MDKLPCEIVQYILTFDKTSTISLTCLNKLLYSYRKYFYININYHFIDKIVTEFQFDTIFNVNDYKSKTDL